VNVKRTSRRRPEVTAARFTLVVLVGLLVSGVGGCHSPAMAATPSGNPEAATAMGAGHVHGSDPMPEGGLHPAPEGAGGGQAVTGIVLLTAALPLLPVLAAPAPADDTQLPRVLKGLMCMCGCSLTVTACEGAMTCDVARRMKEEAIAMLNEGQSPAQALDSFARDYGERVLAAPTKRGFNLTAWILPFAGLGGGAVAVVLALRRWGSMGPPPDQGSPTVDPAYLARVEEAVKQGI
jgi:cytochrome c-type biogenesis protein CcmH/NrfF